MLAQFQSLYPNGSLISELVQIFQGKYIVRVSVDIEGVTRASGMAAADTVEVAEDQARTRALMVLPMAHGSSVQQIENLETKVQQPQQLIVEEKPTPPSTSSTNTANVLQTEVTVPQTQELKIEANLNRSLPIASEFKVSPATVQQEEQPPQQAELLNKSTYVSPTEVSEPSPLPAPVIAKSDDYRADFEPTFAVTATSQAEVLFDTHNDSQGKIPAYEPEYSQLPLQGISGSNVMPFPQQPSYGSGEDGANQAITKAKRSKKSQPPQPIDHSDTIAKTDVEIERLGWTPEQGREHLVKTYRVKGRSLLSDEQLFDFLTYLKSQPSPMSSTPLEPNF
jgi:hypothetical protein